MELFELHRDDRRARRVRRVRGRLRRGRNGADGFVSIEVSPGAANDATATISEATRLWATVDRPNVMVKVPGTVEGAKAVRQLIGERHQRQHHAAVRDRRVQARDRRATWPVSRIASRRARTSRRIHSVASFFVSRVDTEIDKRLDAAAKARRPTASAQGAQGQGGDRQREARVQAVSDRDRVAALEGAGGAAARRCSVRSGRARARRIRRTAT